MYLSVFVGFLCLFLFVLHYVCFSFAIILTGMRELVDLLLLSFGCLNTVNVMWLFLRLPWVGLQLVIVVFPDHTQILNRNILFTTLLNGKSFICMKPFSMLNMY